MKMRYWCALVLVGLLAAPAFAANTSFTVTAGSGTNVTAQSYTGGNIALGQMICDPTTQYQCASVTASNAVKVDGSAVTQPVSLSVLPALTAGSAIIGKVDVLGNGGATLDTTPGGAAATNAIQVQGVAGMAALTVSQATAANLNATIVQATAANLNATVVGTVGLNAGSNTVGKVDVLGNGGAILDAPITAATAPANGIAVLGQFNSVAPSLTSGQTVALQTDGAGNLKVTGGVGIGSTTSGQTGSLVMGAATSGPPAYTTAQTDPLSLDLVGNLREVPSAGPSSGATPFHALSAATNNSTSIKGSGGTVYSLTVVQTTTTLGDFRFYDSASAPTCSSATGAVTNYAIQSSATSAGLHLDFPVGLKFINGIGFCLTGAVADNDNTSFVTGVQINVGYN